MIMADRLMSDIEWIIEWLRSTPHKEQVATVSALAAAFKKRTGKPIMLHWAQMKLFREAGVDCSNLMLYPEIPK